MGNRSKDAASAVPTEKRQEIVIDADFTSLMDNFSSANLFSHSQSALAVTEEKSKPEKPGEDDIVTHLKRLHLRRPIKVTHRLRKLRRKGKADLNLSVAAGSVHRPVIWPGRLKSSTASAGSKILHPARLSVLTSLPKQATESVEKSELENRFNSEIVATLQGNTALDLKNVSTSQGQLSHKLPEGEKGAVRVFGITESESAEGTQAPSFLSVRQRDSEKQLEKGQNAVEAAHRSEGFLRLRSTSQYFPECSSTEVGRRFVKSDSNTPETYQPHGGSQNRSLNPSSQLPATVPSSTSEGAHVTRSCSHEMRLEETNVNELASYLEDLLHIPRKMSTMAEMMYA